MDRELLWAPWRLAYVKDKEPPQPKPALELLPGGEPDCFLCRAVADTADRENLVVHRGAATVTLLNRYPYNNGHLLVAPHRHWARLDELDAATQAESVAVLSMWTGLLEREMNAQGFNIGLNLGHIAGAGTPGHLHWHLIPRWLGDTNFMPTVAGVRIIPQALDELWQLLTDALASES